MRYYKNYIFLIPFTIIIFTIGFIIVSNQFLLELISLSRFNFIDSTDNSSLLYRLDSIINNFNSGLSFFIGDFMKDIRINYMSGYEAHSHISILNQFGIIPFILFLYMLFVSFKNLNGKGNNIKALIMVFNFSIIFFKSFLYPFFWFNYSLSKNKNYQ